MANPLANPVANTLRSPFQGHQPAQRANAAGQTGVHLCAEMLPSVTLISTWISGLPGLRNALAEVLGQALPQHTGETLRTAQGLLVHTAPEEFMLIGEDATDRCTLLRSVIGTDMGAITDLTHARCRIHISGMQCRSTLSKLFALDLRASAFPLDRTALTGTHHVPSMLHRLGLDAFDLYVFSTYAHDQLASLVDAGLEFGVGVELG